MVEQWHASGVSAREFAESHGVSPSQLYAWARASAPPKPSAAIAFTEVRTPSRRVDLHADVQSRASIEIDVARRVVRVHGVVDLAQLEAVLAMVARC